MTIIKVGGKIIEEENTLFKLLNDFSKIEGAKVFVHGGGRLATGFILFLSPLTHDRKGTLLNTNADTIAGETAKTSAKSFDVTLVFCFEKNGVLYDEQDDNSVIPQINRDMFEEYKNQGIIQGGMLPKLKNSFHAMEAGVRQVIITNASEINSGKGTIISNG